MAFSGVRGALNAAQRMSLSVRPMNGVYLRLPVGNGGLPATVAGRWFATAAPGAVALGVRPLRNVSVGVNTNPNACVRLVLRTTGQGAPISGARSMASATGGRSMNAQEKRQFKGWFPNLNVDAAVVTGEATTVYNCISWTLGITDRWVWPGSALANFDSVYGSYGFRRAGNGPIAAWGLSTSNMTHGSISGPSHGPRWESKCGSSLRIQHGLNELESSGYGRVVAFYARTAAATVSMLSREKMEKLSEPEKALLEKAVGAVPSDLKIKFEAAFKAWKETWFKGSLAVDSNPYTRAQGAEFDALIALGPQVVPLVVGKLAHEDNFLALPLYEALQGDQRLVVEYEVDDIRHTEGEQGRAVRTVKSWLAQ